MKLRTKHIAFAAAAAASLSASGLASAQLAGDTISYFYGQNPQARDATDYAIATKALPAGFVDSQVAHQTGVVNSIGQKNSVSGPNVFPNGDNRNLISQSYQLGGPIGNDIGTGADGSIETITSAFLYLNITDFFAAGGNTSPQAYSIYAGNGYTTGDNSHPTGAELYTFNVASSDVGSFLKIEIPLSVLSSGFMISTPTGVDSGNATSTSRGFNAASVDNTDGTLRPGFSVYTEMILPVPEPSTALLGALGTLVLFRRRRI